MTSQQLLKLILSILEDMKAVEITTIDVHKITDITDNMVICSGTSSRHTQSIANRLIMKMKDAGIQPVGIEGEDLGEWILVDLGDAIVHIMLPKTREFYSLEKLWTTAEQVRHAHAN